MLKKSFWALSMIFALVMINGCSGGDDSGGCGKVKNVSFQTGPVSVFLSYSGPSSANSFRIEYGPTGFAEGTGTVVTTSSTSPTISGLTPSTTYDFYIKTVCSADASGTSYKLSSVTTDQSQCTGAVDLQVSQFSANTLSLYCTFEGSPDYYEVEYGLQGFARGTGTDLVIQDYSADISDFEPATAYDFYIRAICYDGDATPWKKVQFTTATTCPAPNNLGSDYISGSCSAQTMKRNFYWYDDLGSASNYTVSIVSNTNVNNPSAGQQFTTSNSSIVLQNLSCTWVAFYVKSNCGSGESSAWTGPFYW